MFKSSGLRPQVHPIDGNSVPYSFSSTVSSLLQNTARALNLHELSGKAFYSAFHSSSNAASNQSSKHDTYAEGSPSSTIITHPRQQVQHLICLYQKLASYGSDIGMEDFSQVLFKTRPPSPGGRSAHFVSAIDSWFTYISRPPIGLVSPSTTIINGIVFHPAISKAVNALPKNVYHTLCIRAKPCVSQTRHLWSIFSVLSARRNLKVPISVGDLLFSVRSPELEAQAFPNSSKLGNGFQSSVAKS